MVSQLFCSSDFLANSFSKINRRQRLIEVLEEALLQFRGEVDGYEDDTKKISILDPNLMLEAGWQKALSYLRKINETRSHTPIIRQLKSPTQNPLYDLNHFVNFRRLGHL